MENSFYYDIKVNFGNQINFSKEQVAAGMEEKAMVVAGNVIEAGAYYCNHQ